MKMQALALGAALGFLVAVAPSCGQTQCSAANCAGCCSKAGTCVDKPNNGNNTTCGTSGTMCADCSATNTACDSTTFSCGASATGGGAAGGSATAGGSAGGAGCDGCRLASGTCVRRGAQQNNNVCGSNSETCKVCSAPTPSCTDGACIAPPKRVGDACDDDSQCQGTLGPAAKCKKTTKAGNFEYPGGMCTVENCSQTSMCPAEAGLNMGVLGQGVCLNLPRYFGEDTSACFPAGCTPVPTGNTVTQGNCRSGFICIGIGNNMGGCLPQAMFVAGPNGEPPPYDVTQNLHNTCTFNSDCQNPAAGAPAVGGVCLSEVQRRVDGGIILQADGGPTYTGNPGGQCSRECRIDEECSTNANEELAYGVCLPISQTAGRCQRGCNNPIGGQSNCRPDYICESLNLPDGGQLPTGYCESRCDVPGGTCGNFPDGGRRSCFPNGYCDFGGGRQDAGEMPVVPDAGSTGGGSAGGGTAGGSTAGGTAGGSTAGGSTAGGTAGGEAGGSAGGATAGGSAGGATAGGSAGGATAGGSAGGATAGGSTAGGSTAGGSAGGAADAG